MCKRMRDPKQVWTKPAKAIGPFQKAIVWLIMALWFTGRFGRRTYIQDVSADVLRSGGSTIVRSRVVWCG